MKRKMSKRERLLELISLARADRVHTTLGRERLTLEENRNFIKECIHELMGITDKES